MKRLIVDVSSVLWMSLLAGKDQEFGKEVDFNGKKVWINGWQFGVECALNHLTSVMKDLDIVPTEMIFVVEGKMSKARRQAIYSGYKVSRDRPQEAYPEFNRAKDELTTAFRNVGAQIVTQDGVEADDVIAYLVRNLDGTKIIRTNDGDMTTLLTDPSVFLYNSKGLTQENKYGPFPHKYVPVYKALVGDGDEYKGAAGFGPKSFLDFLVWAGDQGLAAIEGMILRKTLHELEEDVAEFKPMRKIVDGAAHVYESYECALLHDEWCNTLRQPLVWQAGMVRGRDVVKDSRLQVYAQSVRLITAENYEQAVGFFKAQISSTPIFSLDIETSTPEESDDWLAAGERENKVDVLGSELTGMGLTFGRNNNITYYFSVDHTDTDNVTSEQVRDIVGLIPQGTPIVIQNFAFEGPILYAAWGEAFKNNGWHGFLPNVIDTAILASYTDENLSMGLKQNSKHYLGYDQTSYQEVTTKEGVVGTLKGGRVIKSWEVPVMVKGTQSILNPETEQFEDVEVETQAVEKVIDAETGLEVEQPAVTLWEKRSFKMNEMTGQEVLSYGADDTICTAALFNHFKLRMEIEKTWNVMLEVEQLPAYVIALAYSQGTKFSLERMKEIEREDAQTYDEKWAELRDYLIARGWEGTVTPHYQELTPANIKEMVPILFGEELKTMVRTVSRLAKLVEAMDHADAPLLAQYIAEGNLDQINDWIAQRFTGEPIFDIDSPKQMRKFLYETLNLPVRIVNATTPTERQNKPLLARLVSDHKKRWAGHETPDILPAMFAAHCSANGLEFPCDTVALSKSVLMTKAKTDDTAVDFALAMDVEEDSETARILKCVQQMKKCATRRKMFYKPYANLRHWKDNKIHGQAGQCRTVTRRFAPSEPNLAQLPKKGEGVKFRECFLPHHKNAVIVSVDFAGQELRQGAGQSGDENMMACFVGDDLKDMHSMTAAGAMEKKWGKTVLASLMERFGHDGESMYDLFLKLRKCKEDYAVAKMADDLRKNAKNVNFGAQYDAQAPKLAETLIIPVVDAEAFLQAKYAMFPRFEAWKDEVKADAQRLGYVTTPLGARRHLRDALLSDEWGVADKALRQGPNFKIQGASAEQTKLAMARLWRSGILFSLDMVFFAVIHDECVFSVSREDVHTAVKTVNWCMTQPYGGLPVPFLGSISLGPNFGTQYECGDTYDEAAVADAVTRVLNKEAQPA